MFILSFNSIWSFSYLFFIFYILLMFSVLLYVLPIIKDLINFKTTKTNSAASYLTGYDFYWLLLTFITLLLLSNYFWTSFTIGTWFGHLVFSNLQKKFVFLTLFGFYIVLVVYSSVFYWTTRELYDYWLVLINFHVWMTLLFFANTLFTLIFFIELLSTLIFLLIVTSTFSSTYFYNNINFNQNNYFQSTLPYSYLQTLMFFFWVSLLTSLNLFFSLILFYVKFTTFDWYLSEIIFYYFTITNSFRDTMAIFLIWLFFFFCVFLKCGLVPFYFWKPVFFRGMPFHVLFFYISYFYFFLFLFFLIFFLTYISEIFIFFIFLFNLFLIFGLVFLFAILCEAYYIKIFLALSSILNTLFIFLALTGINSNSFILYL